MPDIESDVSVRIRVLSQQRQYLGGPVDIDFEPQGAGQVLHIKAADASKDIDISGLQRTPQGLCRVTVTPASGFQPLSQLVNVPANGFNTFEFTFGAIGAGLGAPTGSDLAAGVSMANAGAPNTVDESGMAAEISARLAGSSADGSQLANVDPTTIIWVEHGDEVVVHLDSVQVRLLAGSVLVSVDLETDQTGRTTLVAAFAFGAAGDPAGLTAVTDDLPRGLGTLSARWGKTLQLAIWAAILGFAQDSAVQQGGAPIGIAVAQGSLTVIAGAGLTANARRAA